MIVICWLGITPPELIPEIVTMRFTESKEHVGKVRIFVPIRLAHAEFKVGVMVVGKVILIIPVSSKPSGMVITKV